MKSLKESIFSDVEDIVNSDSALIEQFINDNYKIEGSYTIKDGVVDVKGTIRLTNRNAEFLTNGAFQFGTVSGGVSYFKCRKLKSLLGSPKKVEKGFYCYSCTSLVSLEGAPREVGADFSCIDCESLVSLAGAPEKVGRDFDCGVCPKLTSLEGAPKKVGGDFYCRNCVNLRLTDEDRQKYKIRN